MEDVAATVEATATATDDVMLVRRVRAALLVTSSPNSVVALDEDVVVMLLLLSRKAVQAGHRGKGFPVRTSYRLCIGLFAALQNGIGYGEMRR